MRAGLLALILFVTAALAQQDPEGGSHVASAFTTGADPGVFAANVRVGPTLRASLGADADSRRIYEALFERASGKKLRIRALSAAETSRYAALVGGSSDPLMLVEAGDVALLMQYAPRDKNVAFVEQLAAKPSARIAPKPQAVTPQLAPAPPKPAVVLEAPLPAPVVVEKPKPAIKPVVFEKPVPIVVPPQPAPRIQADCVIKPVMTDDELRACGAR